MSIIAEAIEAWRGQKLNGSQLMRSIVNYPHWQVPISEAAAVEALAHNGISRLQFNRDPKGVNRLMLWSSDETLATWAKGGNLTEKQHILKTDGPWIFSLDFGDRIDEIWIDPLNAHDILYTKKQFPRLRGLAKAIPIENDLTALRAGTATDGAVVRVREYANYLVPVADAKEGRHLVFAPDTQGRALAAVFTSDDGFDTFLPEAQAARPGVEILCVELDGARLFKTLSGMDLTGIVFNCSGPIRPVAFAGQFSQVVLEA